MEGDVHTRLRGGIPREGLVHRVRELETLPEAPPAEVSGQEGERANDRVPRLLRHRVRARTPRADEAAALDPDDHVRRGRGAPARDHERLRPGALVDPV